MFIVHPHHSSLRATFSFRAKFHQNAKTIGSFWGKKWLFSLPFLSYWPLMQNISWVANQ
jgi:hypothetical protein